MKSGSMCGATAPAPRGSGSDVRRLGVFAVIAVLMMLSVAVVPLATSGPASSQTAAPSDDYAGQDITYHYGSGDGRQVTVHYDGIAATEYNPEYWEGTFASTSGTGTGNWIGPEVTYESLNESLTFERTVRWSIAADWWGPGLDGGSLELVTSSDIIEIAYSSGSTGSLYANGILTVEGSGYSERNTGSGTFTFTVRAATVAATVNKVFAGWSTSDDGTLDYYPGDVVPSTVTDLYAVWADPSIYVSDVGDIPVINSGDNIQFNVFPTFKPYKSVSSIYQINSESLSSDRIHRSTHGESESESEIESESERMFVNIFSVTSSDGSTTRGYSINIPCTIRSQSGVNLSFGTISLGGDTVIDNVDLTSSAPNNNHGDGSDRGIFANGHRLILGTGIGTGAASFNSAPQVFGGGTFSVTTDVDTKSIVSADAELSRTVDLGTFVIVHSGTYYNIVGGGADSDIGSKDKPLSTYVVLKGGMSLDTVVGGSGAGGSVYGSAAPTWENGPDQGGTYIYSTGFRMPGDSYHESKVGTDCIPDGMWLEESTIMEGGVSGRDSNNYSDLTYVYGSTHIFLSGDTDIWDVQAGSRRAFSHVEFAYLEISGNAVVRHVACGTITDGNRQSSSQSSPMPVTSVDATKIVVTGNAWVASVFGAGYDTWYLPEATTMADGERIDVQIKGGTVGSVYGGGYRGTITVGNPDDTRVDDGVFVEISGGTVLGDVYGGGRGGLDKVTHSSGGGINSEGYMDSTGHSVVIGDVFVIVSGGTVKGSVYGGGESVPKLSSYSGVNATFSASDPDVAAVDGDTNVLVNGGTVEGSVYGGGKGVLMHNGQPYDAPMEVPAIVGTAGSYSYQDILWKSGGGAVYDSSVDYTGYARVTGSTMAMVMGGTVNGNIYGGAEIGRVNATANVQVLGYYPVSIQGSVYGGGEGHNQYPALGAVSNTSVRIADAEVTGSVYGGGAYGMVMSIDGVRGTADVDVEASVVHGDVYGGGQGVEAIADSGRVGTVVLDISEGSTVDGSVYGGGQYGASDTIGVTVTGSTVGGSIYGGGLGTASRTSVFGNVALTVDSTTVTGNIYGGSAYGLVEGNIVTEIRGGTVASTVYGGGLGTSNRTSTSGSRTVRLEGVRITGSLYGGSQNGDDGAANLDTFVDILSAEIGGSVFGGGYRGITWGDTYVYIGCTESETPHEGTVTIGQSVYGGGDVGDVSVGDALFDTTLVYGNSELIVDGSSCTINFNGSLFGEGNSCLTEGDTTIHITDASLEMMSVQRADTVRITSSEIHLEGRNSGTSSSASEKFSFYSVGRLDLVGGSQIYLSSPLGETGDFYSLATPSVLTTQTAPLNTIYVEEGTIFSLQNSEGFGKVYGYTVLSLLASETYYGAFAYGSVDSVGGFVTDDEGLYRTLQYSDLSSPECRYWYIPGVVSQTGSAVLKYDPDIGEGTLVSDELKLDIPMTSSGTSLLYGGGYFTSATADAFRLVSGDPTEYGSLSVLMGYAGEGLTSFNNGTGLYVPDRSSETTYVVLEDAGGPDSPRIGIKVSGINPMLSGYAGTVTIQFREVVVADSPEGETNYVYFNTIDVSIAIYIEGHDHPHEGSSTIDIIAGSGQSTIVIPALGYEGDLYVTDARFNGGSLEGAPALTIAGVNNHEGSMGWTGGGFEHVLTAGSESAYLGRFTGMFPSTIQFSIEGFEGTDCSFAIDFEVRVTNGETYQFTITVKVVTHGPVTVTFVDSRQNVSIPMQFDYGTTITASDGPQVMGNFIGWYNDETFTSQFNFNSPLIRDITLYARYMYTVTFDEMYDGRTSTYYVPMGEPFTIDNYGDKDPVRPGYEFTGWYKDRDCLVLWDFKNDKVEGDITLYAGWQPRGVILDFHNEDGDVILTLGAGEGERIRLDDLFGPYLEQAVGEFGDVPEGGTLVWYVSVSGSSIPVYADNAIEQSMVTVEGGGWHVKVHADVLYNSITVVQDAQDYGSTVVPPKEFAVGPEGGYYTFTPTGADRVGYELSGWIIERTSQEYAPGVTIEIPASEVGRHLSDDGKLHLVAQWRALSYEVVVMKPAGGSVTATLISSDGSTSSGREYTSYISFSAHYGDRLSLSYVSEGGYTFEGWVVSKAGAIDDASEQSTYMTVRGDSRVEVRVGGLESAVIRLSVDGAAPGGSITLTGDGRTYTVRQSSVDGEYGVFSVSALLGEYALSYGGSGFGTITVVSGGVSGSYRLVSLALKVTPDADVGSLPSYAVPGTQLTLDVPHGYSVSKLTLGYDGAEHDMGAVNGFTVPSAQSTGITVKVELETSNYTIEFVVDFTGPDGSKVVFDKVASITVEYSPEGTVYPELPWVQLNGLDLNALDRETTSPYSFLGWYLDDGFMQRVQAGDAFPEEDVVLHASIADRKEIIYVVNVYMMGIGGDYPATPTYEIQTIELENQYVGWRPDYPGFAVDSGRSDDYLSTVVEAGMDDLDIYMVRASGTAVLDPAGGTVSESDGWTLDEEGNLTREIWYGETVTLPVPVKTENVFGGWSVGDSTVTQVTVGDGMWDQADNTVSFEGTAQWTVNEYRLVLSTLYGTFLNDQTTMTVSVPYGTPLSGALDGYRAELEEEAGMYADFVGWSPAPPETMPANTLTLTAQWTPKKVSISVTGDEHVTISVSGSSLIGSDGSYESVFNGSIDLMLSFDSGYSLYEATGAKEQPVRKSAVQFEWTVPLNSGNVAVGEGGTLSLTLNVVSVESAVTVTYVINGTPAASLFQNVPSGEDVVLHDLSGLQGLTFDGWYSDPEMKNRIEGNTIPFVDADDKEVVYGSLTADKPTGHITASDLVLDNGVYVGTYNSRGHSLTAVPDTYAEGPTALDYDLTYRIIWDDKVNSTENRTISFINAGEYSVTLRVIATLTIGGMVSDVSEAPTEEFKIRIDKANAEVVWVHDDAYVYNGADRSGTVYAYYVGMDSRNHQLTVSFLGSFRDVGDYTFTVPEEDSNHKFSNTTLSLSIEKKVLTITQDGSLSYNGQAQSPTFTDDRVTGDDISHDITDSKTDAGTYTISLAGVQLTGTDARNYELPASVIWAIDRVAAKDLRWEVVGTYTYTGSEVIPKVQAYIGGEKVDMVLDKDYSVVGMQGKNNTNAGTAYVLVECTGNYSGRAEVEFEIGKLDLSTVVIEITGDTTYTGKRIIPEYTVTAADGTPLKLTAKDVMITFGDNIKVADGGSITISAIEGSSGNCVNFATKKFTIHKAEAQIVWTGADAEYIYDGTDQKGRITAVFEGVGGESSVVLTVIIGSGSEFRNAGEYTFSVDVSRYKDNYSISGDESVDVTMGKRSVTLTSASGEKVYDGTPLTNGTVTVSGDGFVGNEGATFNVTGTQTAAGHSKNLFEYSLKEGTLKGNYSITKIEGTLEVTKRTLNLTWSDYEGLVYNGSNQKPTYTDDRIGGDVIEFSVTIKKDGSSVSECVGAGSYTITVSVSGGEDAANYALVNGTLAFTIGKADATIVWTGTDADYTYNGKDQSSGITAVFNGVGAEDSVDLGITISLNGPVVQEFKDAGTYTFSVDVSQYEVNYGIAGDKSVSVYMNKKILSIVWGDTDFTYNGQQQAPTVEFGGFAEGDSADPVWSVTGDDTTYTDAGAYTITVTGIYGTCASNYVLPSEASLEFEIERKQISASQADKFTYDGTDKTVSFVLSGHIEADKGRLDYSIISGGTQRDAGTHTAVVELTGEAAGNYCLPSVESASRIMLFSANEDQYNVQWTIGQLSIVGAEVAIGDYDSVYDGNAKEPGVTGVTLNELTLTGEDYSVSYRDNIDAGTAYVVITAKEGGNYTGTAEKEFRISKKEIEVHIDTTVPLKYNGQEQTAVLDDSWSEYVVGMDAGKVTVSLGDGKTATNAGTYSATVVLTDGSGNYELSATELEWSIAKRTVTLTSADESKVYDGTALIVNKVEIGGDGFADGEGATCTFTGSQKDAGTSKNEFTYVLNGGTLANNYEITTSYGDLTVSPRPIMDTGVTIEGIGSYAYTGSENKPDIKASFNGVSLIQEKDYTLSYSGELVSVTEDGAIVTITGIGNYDGTRTVMFSIVPKEIEIEWGSDLSFTYNGSNQAPECKVSSGIDGVEVGTVGFTVTKDGSETESYADVGSYVLTITSVSNTNLTVPEGSSIEFRIDQKTVGVSLSEWSFTYNGQAHEVNIVDEGIIDTGVEASAAGTTSATDAGTYTVTLSLTGDVKGNYKLSATELEWTIDPLSLDDVTIVIDGGDFVYTGGEITPDITVTVTVDGAPVTIPASDYTVGYKNNTDAGEATITVTPEGGNCTGSATETFEILQKEVTIDWGYGTSLTFNGDDQRPGFDIDSGIEGITVNADFKVCQNGVAVVSYADAGSYTLVITGLDNDNFKLPTDTDLDFEIVPLEISAEQEESFTYNGSEKKVSFNLSGYIEGHVPGYEIVEGGTGTDAGTYTATIRLTGPDAGNYVLSESSERLSWTIAPKKVTPHLEQAVFTYSGKPHRVAVIVPGILNDEASVKIEGGGSGTIPGSYTVRFSLDGEGKDNYSLTATELQWTIGKLSLAGADVEITGEYTYTGSEIDPEMTVTVNGLTLAKSDYYVSYSDNVNAGTVKVTVIAKDTSFFTGETHGIFEIKRKPVSVSVSETVFTYDGKEHIVTVTLSEAIEGIALVTEGELKGTDAGSYDVTFSLEGEGSGNYVLDSGGFTWAISKRSLQDADISLKGDHTYTGSQICPGVIVTIGDLTLEEGIDYEVSYGDNRNVSDGGTVTITAVGGGNFDGDKEVRFGIGQKEVDVSLSSNSFVYDGHEKSVTLNHEGIVDEGVSVVTVEGSILSATQAGTYTVYLSLSGEGSGNYYLSEDSLTWTIGKLNLGGSGADIDIGDDFVYCASQIRPDVTVTVGDAVLKEGIDYKVSYGDNIFAGQGSVTVTALDGGSLSGSRTIGFTIEKRPVHVILGEVNFEYSGSVHKVSVSVNGSDILDDGVRLVTNGTLSAKDRGTYTVNLSLEGEGREDNYALNIPEFTWTIDGKSISDADVHVSDGVYTGSAIIPGVTVKVDGATLAEGTDYILSYDNNINAGEGSVTITAMGNYVGSITVSFDIAQKALSVSLVDDSFVFDGTKHSVVLDHISGIAAGDDVVVSLEGKNSATHAGEYHVDVVMTGADSGNYYLRTTGFTWIIEQRGLHDAVVTLVDGSTYTYTGSQIMPDVTVTVGGMTPVKGTDYSVSYSNNINAGTGTVIVTAKEDGDYAGAASVNFEIAKKVLEPMLSEGSFVYDEEEHTVELSDLSASIAQGDDLKVYLRGTISATDAGTYYVKAVMEGSDAGNYSLMVTAFTWTIEKADLGSAHVTVPDGLIHTGSEVEPDVSVELGVMTLVAGRDYTLSYADNVDAGRATVTVTAVKDGNFEGSVTVGFDIGRAHLNLVEFADPEDAVYHGSAHTPEISAEYNGSELIEGTHYTVEYHDNIEAGTATVVLRAVDGSNFTGYRHLTFDISPASVDGFGIGDVDDRVYTGSPIEPGITAVFNGTILEEWEDYVLRYVDNTDAGTAAVIVEGRGNFSGVREINFTIAPASMEDVSIAPVPDQMYTGTAVRPGITAALNGVPLVEGEDYILSYVGDTVNVTGDYVYVVAEGMGNLTGTVSIPYRIVYDGLQDITGITVGGYTGVYDGMEHIAVTVTGTMQGDKVSYSTDGTAFVSEVPTVTHVSDSGVVWVKVERPGCVPTMFGVSVTVAPAEITLESSSVQGMYDGEPLTGHEVTVVNGQLFGNDGFDWVFSGQQTAPGSSANTFVPVALPGTEAGDYIITTVYGTLTVDQSVISENSSWVLALILVIGVAAASYHGVMWVSGGRPLEALSALASRLASVIRRV